MSQRVTGRLGDLEAERNFLLDSISDLDREHLAGDLDESDYVALRGDYVRRAAATLRAIEELQRDGVATDSSKVAGASRWGDFRRMLGRPRVRLGLGAGSALCLLAAAGLFAAHLAGVRLPGESATGSITMSQAGVVAQDLSKAALEANSGSPADAILLYQAVLAQVPDQQVALTYGGWLTRLSGLSAKNETAVKEGDADLEKAVKFHSDYADGEGLYGIVAYEDLHSNAAAVRAFQRCLADSPSAEVIAGVASVARSAYSAVGKPIPKAFATA